MQLTSDEIKELAGALARAQMAMGFARKDSKNPHFQSSYADLASVWDACRDHLTTNGLCVSQVLTRDLDGKPCLRTLLMHQSGEWIASEYPLIGDISRPQVLGSLLTYARRYSLAAIVGIAQDDDDGNAAQQHAEQRRPASRPDPPPAPLPAYKDWLEGVVKGVNAKWVDIVAGLPDGTKAPAEVLSVYQLNRNLLKALSIGTGKSEADNFKAGERCWRDNHDEMRAQARAYSRHVLDEAKAKAKPTREPGSDDMPTADEDAVLDAIAAKGV